MLLSIFSWLLISHFITVWLRVTFISPKDIIPYSWKEQKRKMKWAFLPIYLYDPIFFLISSRKRRCQHILNMITVFWTFQNTFSSLGLDFEITHLLEIHTVRLHLSHVLLPFPTQWSSSSLPACLTRIFRAAFFLSESTLPLLPSVLHSTAIVIFHSKSVIAC